MKGTQFKRILSILFAVLLCIGMMPVSAIADGYVAANELRVMQKTRQEIDNELLELEDRLRSGSRTVVETVDRLFEHLKGDSRIENLERQSDTAFGYTLKSGMTVVYDYNIVHGIRLGSSEPIELDLKQEETRQIINGDAATSSNNNVVVYSPYFGISEEFSNYYPEQIAPIVSSYTGGTLTVYAGNDCDVSKLRDMVNYGVVFYDSHGLEYEGLSYVCIYNENGITADDFDNGYAIGIVGGGAGLNHEYFRHHLTGRMPACYMHFATCSGGSDGQLLEYFLSIGASAVYGYDNTVTVAYDLYMVQDFLNVMRGVGSGISETYNIGQAVEYGKSRNGNYDPYLFNSDGEYAYPVLKGNSNWYLPPIWTVDFVNAANGNTFGRLRVTKNTVLSVSDFPEPPSVEYANFSHWEGPNGRITDSITVAGNITISAVYNYQKCTVRWIDSMTNQVILNTEVNKGSDITIHDFPEPIDYEGYSFVGWYMNGEDLSGNIITITEDTTFQTVYVPNQYMFYFVDGFSGEQIGYLGVAYGSVISVSAFPEPVCPEGYYFVGWLDENDTLLDPESSITVTGNATFVSAYRRIEYIVYFEDGQGNTIGAISVRHGQSLSIEDFPTPPNREHYTFSHWEVISPEQYPVDQEIEVYSSMVVSAVYVPNSYCVSFVDGYDNTIISSSAIDYGTVLNVSDFPIPPSHDGMNFVGWFINDQQVETETVMVEGDIAVVAVYEIISTPGDINGDGEIEAEDALMVLRHAMVLNELTEEEIERADVNRDGVVNSIDALLTLRMALGIIEAPTFKPLNTFKALDI